MNTTENNKIIAEFLGESKQPYEFSQFGYMTLSGDWKDTFFVEQLKFHSNWNWLMKVVEKIESLEFYPKNSTCISFDTFGIEINKERCDITRYGDFTNHLIQGNGRTRIETVYNACVKFIEWYNLQEHKDKFEVEIKEIERIENDNK